MRRNAGFLEVSGASPDKRPAEFVVPGLAMRRRSGFGGGRRRAEACSRKRLNGSARRPPAGCSRPARSRPRRRYGRRWWCVSGRRQSGRDLRLPWPSERRATDRPHRPRRSGRHFRCGSPRTKTPAESAARTGEARQVSRSGGSSPSEGGRGTRRAPAPPLRPSTRHASPRGPGTPEIPSRRRRRQRGVGLLMTLG